jgi:ribosomal protein L11 methyltransferase
MGWVSVAMDVEAECAEAVADALLERGACSVDVSDAQAGSASERPIFDEPDEAAGGVWSLNRVSALFDEHIDYRELVLAACRDVGLAGAPAIVAHKVAEQDWVEATQRQFDPVRISDRLWIVPSWCEPPAPDAINLRLDPGLAFGTGSHPTTWQCLSWLDQHLRGGQSVLDYGCGSGILAIAAKRLGAGVVFGVDVDAGALRVSAQNAQLNGVEVPFADPEALPETLFDVVVANILANPLRVLAPLLAARTRPRGYIVLAGILQSQADAVRLAYANWFDLVPSMQRDGWTCLSGARRE